MPRPGPASRSSLQSIIRSASASSLLEACWEHRADKLQVWRWAPLAPRPVRTETRMDTCRDAGARLALRYALRWRAIVVCRRAAVLAALWDQLRFRFDGKLDETPDPSLPLRAARLFAGDPLTSPCPDFIHVLIHCLLDGAEAAAALGFEWRTGQLGKVEMLRFEATNADGWRYGSQYVRAVHARVDAIERLSKILPESVLNLAAADIRLAYEMFALDSSSW